VLNLLADLRTMFGMSYLFVSHDLEVVRLMCDRIIVMRGGAVTGSLSRAEATAESVMRLALGESAA
jgi:peptide/nickel transport system ATP-binding protein